MEEHVGRQEFKRRVTKAWAILILALPWGESVKAIEHLGPLQFNMPVPEISTLVLQS